MEPPEPVSRWQSSERERVERAEEQECTESNTRTRGLVSKGREGKGGRAREDEEKKKKDKVKKWGRRKGRRKVKGKIRLERKSFKVKKQIEREREKSGSATCGSKAGRMESSNYNVCDFCIYSMK